VIEKSNLRNCLSPKALFGRDFSGSGKKREAEEKAVLDSRRKEAAGDKNVNREKRRV